MSTRAITEFIDHGEVVARIYKHGDGYPTWWGQELADFLKGINIVNGISITRDRPKEANGMGCLAAQFIAEVKDGIGSVYLVALGDNDWDADYNYKVYMEASRIILSAHSSSGKLLFQGSPKTFDGSKVEGKV